jgi:5-deoxy-glucuronate isomerase
MSFPLLRRPDPKPDGRYQHVTPENAGWTYVGFSAWRLDDGARLAERAETEETCIVILTGIGRFLVEGREIGPLGGRMDLFSAPPVSLYVPPGQEWSVVAEGPLELGICRAPATGKLPFRIIRPEEVGLETRGREQNTRHVRNILPESAAAESLLVVEVITPGGNWSSYPSHKHDQDDLPHESYLEETYYHRIARPGFAMQRVYTDDGSLDETMTVHDRDVVLVPKGYHPVGAPYGFDLYYLNVMAGPHRTWKFRYDERVTFLLA